MAPLFYDDRIINHECAHALFVVLAGAPLHSVRTRWRDAIDDHGTTSWDSSGVSNEAAMRVVIAGNVERSAHSWKDEKVAHQLWVLTGSDADWLEARFREVRRLLHEHRRVYTRIL